MPFAFLPKGIITFVTISLAQKASQKYTVETDLFQGPLDLLLQLIERAELDISKLALAHVTDQFIEHMRLIQEQRAERVSEFLLVAARLMQIKSEALLPRPVIRLPEEEDPGEALIRQLLMYKRFKELAAILANRQAANLRSYIRLAPPPKVEGKLDLSDVTAQDLHAAASLAFANQRTLETLGNVVVAPRVTIREKIRLIAQRLTGTKTMRFKDLVKDTPNKLHVAMTFLAMLELVRRFRISAKQEHLFGEIELERAPDWKEDLDFEIDYSE